MSQLQFFELQLARLKGDLRQVRLERLAATERPRPDEPAYAVEGARLQALASRWRAIVEPGLRALDSRASLLALRRDRIHEVPREQRFREQQSIDDAQRRLDGVRRLADEAARLLWALDADRHAPPSLHDMLRGFNDIAGELAQRLDQQQATTQALQLVGDGPSLRAAADAAASWQDRANGLVTALVMVVWLLRRLQK